MKCRDYLERYGCLGEADPLFTMNFDDIGEDPIYWCSWCGPQAHALNAAFEARAKEPGFLEQVAEALTAVEQERKKTQS